MNQNNNSALVYISTLGRNRAEAISAIEGQVLTEELRLRFAEWAEAALTPEQQRLQIIQLYKRAQA